MIMSVFEFFLSQRQMSVSILTISDEKLLKNNHVLIKTLFTTLAIMISWLSGASCKYNFNCLGPISSYAQKQTDFVDTFSGMDVIPPMSTPFVFLLN